MSARSVAVAERARDGSERLVKCITIAALLAVAAAILLGCAAVPERIGRGECLVYRETRGPFGQADSYVVVGQGCAIERAWR